MMKITTLPAWLEIINGAWITATICLSIVMICYIRHRFRSRLPGDEYFPQGMRVASAVLTLSVAILVSRLVIYLWRMLGGGPFTDFELTTLLVSASLGVAGFMWAIREYSEPLYGRWVWVVSLLLTIASAIITAFTY